MPFIGKQPAVGSFTLLDSITTSATATYALTKNGDAFYPETARNLLVSLNGVTQAPEDAYTVSGSNIVFASALTSSDVIDYILVLGDVLDIGTPSDGTVGVPQMNSALYSENEFFALPTGTTAQRPASPAEGYIRQNTTLNQLEIYADGEWQQIKNTEIVAASGGTETTITEYGIDYKVHTFTSSGTFTVTNGGEVQYLVIAGGGAGGVRHSGGGGAGGYRCSVSGESSGGGSSAETALTLSAGTYTVTIGAGGAGGTEQSDHSISPTPQSGSDSTFATITSIGGGFGGYNGLNNAASGGSGGGGADTQSGTYLGGSGTSGQGYAGGSGTSSYYGGGGGGGAGQAGETGSTDGTGQGGDGGDGVQSAIDGSATYRAGGGGGAGGYTRGAIGGSGGLGGGGTGDNSAGGGAQATSGATNTGSGGGAQATLYPSAGSGSSGNGGSGIVIIRYAI